MKQAGRNHDVRIFFVMAAVVQLGAAAMGADRHVLWILFAVMSLHAIHPLRSTPLVAAALAPMALRSGEVLPADTVMTAAAYIFFTAAYELEADTNCKVVPVQPAEEPVQPVQPTEELVQNPVNRDLDMDDL